MAAARVSSIASVVSLQAKDVYGVWRVLTEGSSVEDREEILCEADGAQYGLAAYKLQQRVGAAWVDAQSVSLNVPDGTSNYRQDRIAVNGDSTDSSAGIVLTVQKGQGSLRSLLTTLQGQERSRFKLEDGATKFKGLSDDIEHQNKAEIGGFQQEYQGTVLCDRAQFVGATPAAPRRGQKLLWLANGVSYRVEGVKEDEISYAITLISMNK